MKFSSPEQYLEKVAIWNPIEAFSNLMRRLSRNATSTLHNATSAGEGYAEAATNLGDVTMGARSSAKMNVGKGLFDFLAENPKTGLGVLGGGMALGTLGGFKAMEGGKPGDTYSYRVNKGLNNLLDRIRYDEVAGESFAKEMGGGSAKALMGLATDMASKSLDTVKSITLDSPARAAIFKELQKEDPIIGQTDIKTLNDAFHTMASVAPSLSTDKNAVKSVLRLAATSGGGLDYQTIKGLADAEISLKKSRGELR